MLWDPFEAAIAAELEASPPESPVAAPPRENAVIREHSGDPDGDREWPWKSGEPPFPDPAAVSGDGGVNEKGKDDEEEDEEEDNVAVDLTKLGSADLHKTEKIKMVLAQFTKEQMDRYESFRRSNFQRSNMKKLLTCATGNQKISVPMTIVVCGIAKMFVGDLVETGRMIMTERKESGPLRPCHVREAYRRLKLEGKVPRQSVPRLFH